MEKGGFTGPGLVPLRFSEKDHSGYAGEQLTKLANGKATYFGTAFQTDDGAGPVTPLPATAAAPPANGIPPAQ